MGVNLDGIAFSKKTSYLSRKRSRPKKKHAHLFYNPVHYLFITMTKNFLQFCRNVLEYEALPVLVMAINNARVS